MKYETPLFGGAIWIDLVDPAANELLDLAASHDIPEWAVKECLDPEHLPKAEPLDKIRYAILRSYDVDAPGDCDTIQGLTRKIAIFWGPSFVLTVHRREQPHLAALRTRVAKHPIKIDTLVGELARASVATFDKPFDRLYAQFEKLESHAFHDLNPRRMLEDSYLLKRQASLIKRLLRMTLDTLPRLREMMDTAGDQRLRAARESVESSAFYADDLVESVNHLLNLHFSLQTHRQNEVVRTLTMYSAVFLPLGVIVGAFGMNFSNIPGAGHPDGFWIMVVLMFVVAAGIGAWFYRKGWWGRS